MNSRFVVFLFLLAALSLPAEASSVKAGANSTIGVASSKDGQNPAIPGASSQDDFILATMEKELHRGQAELAKQDPAPYFTSYSVTDGEGLAVIGTQGAILTAARSRRRMADVFMRIGSSDLDNTHGSDRGSGITTGQLPIRDDPDALARTLWRLTYEEYRKAREAYTNVKAKNAVRAKEEDESPDFSLEQPSSYLEKPAPVDLPAQETWEELARRYSAAFRRYQIQESVVYLYGEKDRTYLVSTEGTKVVTSDAIFRIMIEGEVLADDGMRLERVETYQYSDPSTFPSQSQVEAASKKIAADPNALRSAPLG